ncbi:ribonuclease P protein component [candidate division WWE3 bacterium RIFCSPHIGHO2_12_FULL_38_15]|uniref:Ribonuclease P protein component n=1 Tax=candidate division WWE3 bacterium RIFCSPHIGHO2_02_FULL_38_14 TaxID=1802620 RepID=A0A1F4V8C2_UNCKA|nr:MAG: ribonuclease P protein component [candidate division WWE3 bacterium RIFCSPHIGHO2_01_FULL_38_45]OGC48680.1 MAG: ribonuclease P protein component [candidate division WWE3 bacterium RIFCSPHIGHO2_12_FULL_38_15]OGC53086.1 MAG: ribonuclease P protein component [candidate division WWE3 bacterium RIFCSPLOWO2_01_FULL_37_24]OGC53449.1 MAG: ribonuclease P protein component [candidate division WWE3 bacterium RIFCSPHIGHO2_02_FULL_38_14]HLB51923.1 ribonuclease P protein component [Patescibacteria gro
MMLKKQHRLSTDYEFNITRKYGKNLVSKFFYLYVLKPKNYEGPPKIGIIVSNKFDKSAAKRNRIKRVYREIIRNNLDKIPSNLWIIVYPKTISREAEYEEINTEFTDILQKEFISGQVRNKDMQV